MQLSSSRLSLARLPRARYMALMLLGLLTILLSACSTTQVHEEQPLNSNAEWGIAVSNHSETPLAGQKAEGMLITALTKRGIKSVQVAPRDETANPLTVDGSGDLQSALTWAQQRSMKYLVTGAVQEWHYKTGLDGEPAVGVSLQVRDANSGEILWSANGSRGGWGFDTLSGVASKQLDKLVGKMPLKP